MISTLLVCSGLMAAVLSDADRVTYEAAKAEAGRDAGAHVRLALWCEAHGLTAERARHLALAVLNDPKNAMARGLMGLVRVDGAWRRPAEAEAKLKADAVRAAIVAEYEQRRARAPHTADAQWKLALWCEENRLKAEAVAHLTAVVKLDPSREAAWKRLGFKKQGKRWVTDAQLAAEKADRTAQEKADRHWRPRLEKWRSWLGDKGKHREQAERSLAAITDARAVPSVVAVFGVGSSDRQAVAVRVLGQIDAPGASRALAALVVFGKSADVRRSATETLRRRDVREFADLLIALVRDPIKYEVRAVNGPGSQGELFIQGKQVNYKRLYSPPPVPVMPPAGSTLSYDANGLPVASFPVSGLATTAFVPPQWAGIGMATPPTPVSPALRHTMADVFHNLGAGTQSQHLSDVLLSSVSAAAPSYTNSYDYAPFQEIMLASAALRPFNTSTKFSFTYRERVQIPIGRMILEAEKSAAGAQQQLQHDVEALEAINAEIERVNGRVLPILTFASGRDLGPDREAWENWWLDQIGFRKFPQKASDKTTVVEQVPLGYQPTPVPVTASIEVLGFRRMSCFGKGTPVRTLGGAKAIETLLPGDLVLAQDLKSGALRYQPILVVHHNPPGKTFRVTLGGETIVSSEFHRFWKAGHGWVMARDLKPGDALRTLGGVVSVSAIETGQVEPVFNLDVAEDADFFVGEEGALVHDNTLPDLRLAPFDAPPALAAAAAE